MAFSLTWLPDVLKSSGLKVAVVPGWESRGRGDIGTVLGVLCHHTAGAKTGNMPSLDLLVKGRQDLPGPLSQLGLGRDGTYYVIAAGRCNHAGNGNWKGITAGNTHFIGIEAEHTGAADSPWPDVQMEAYQRGAAAILKHIGKSSDFCAGHKEYAPKRKPDPSFDMNDFRAAVAAIMESAAPELKPIAPVEPRAEPGAPAGRATLRRGAKGDLVKTVQRKVGVDADGHFGPRTEAAVRAFQRDNDLVPDGIVGPATWAALDRGSVDKA
ncbi:MAG TPA: N-acetylmuramoyl-L-alanine amidase [Blastocatellia bacterium]